MVGSKIGFGGLAGGGGRFEAGGKADIRFGSRGGTRRGGFWLGGMAGGWGGICGTGGIGAFVFEAGGWLSVPLVCATSGTDDLPRAPVPLLFLLLPRPDSGGLLCGTVEPSAEAVGRGVEIQFARTETGSFLPGEGMVQPALRIPEMIFLAVDSLIEW